MMGSLWSANWTGCNQTFRNLLVPAATWLNLLLRKSTARNKFGVKEKEQLSTLKYFRPKKAVKTKIKKKFKQRKVYRTIKKLFLTARGSMMISMGKFKTSLKNLKKQRSILRVPLSQFSVTFIFSISMDPTLRFFGLQGWWSVFLCH